MYLEKIFVMGRLRTIIEKKKSCTAHVKFPPFTFARQVERMVRPAHYSGPTRNDEPRGTLFSATNQCSTGTAGNGKGAKLNLQEEIRPKTT